MIELRHGDCIAGMAELDESSVDAIVCDPPYGLEFMGRDWDSFRMDERSARWASRSGEAGGFGEMQGGSKLPTYGKRRTTSRCLTCGKRDAFRNPHACGDDAEWITEYVDVTPVEMRAFQNWCHSWAVEAYRILKPGGHLLAFGGTRTYHRLTVAVEDAGFEIRDSMIWVYGSGFPKSLDVSKSIDARAGAEREDVYADREPVTDNVTFRPGLGVNLIERRPVTDDAKQWDGWGTALKPAHEPIVVARKPLVGSVAENVLAHGTGALNVRGCEIGENAGWSYPNGPRGNRGGGGAFDGDALGRREQPVSASGGRWPANLVLSHLPECRGNGAKHTEMLCAPGCPVAELNAASGESVSRPHDGYEAKRSGRSGGMMGEPVSRAVKPSARDDAGGAARFFYIAKPKRREKIAGVERSLHPTVKPVELMRWLVRLVTPPGGLVVDPFTGSGTTGCAAILETVDFLGFEQDDDYARQAADRLGEYAYAAGRDDLTLPTIEATHSADTESRLGAAPTTPEEETDGRQADERTRGADRGPARERRPDEDQGRDGGGREARPAHEGQDADGDARGDDLHGREEAGRPVPRPGEGRRRARREPGGDADRAGRAARREGRDDGEGSGQGEAGPEAEHEGEAEHEEADAVERSPSARGGGEVSSGEQAGSTTTGAR